MYHERCAEAFVALNIRDILELVLFPATLRILPTAKLRESKIRQISQDLNAFVKSLIEVQA